MTQIISLLTGAFLGALFGYWFARYQQKQQANAKRHFLRRTLREELGMIGSSVGAYQVEKAFYRDPVHLAALPRLLDSDVLDFRKDAELIGWLLKLQGSVRNYNEFVRIINSAQAVSPIPDPAHQQMHQLMLRYHSAMIEARDEVARRIPQDEQ